MILKFFDFMSIISTEEYCIAYLLEKAALDTPETCSNCSGLMKRYGKIFRCRRKTCRKAVSVFKNSFFGKAKLDCRDVLLIGYLWLSGCCHTTAQAITGHSSATITDYFGHYRDLVSGSMESSDTMIGGTDIVIELDESKFAKRKFHRGHHVEGCWVVGGVERTPERRMFVEVVADRSRQTLFEVISRHVRPGSVVCTDMWRGYIGLDEAINVQHNTVNHSENFVDPDTGTHTNTIEGTWCGIKRKIPIRNRNHDTIEKHLMEFIWRRINQRALWVGLIEALKITYYD